MGNIRDLLNKIRYATYGKEVRQSIHDAIEECYTTASVDHDNANMEVKIARGTHNTLNERFTSAEENIKNNSEQLDNIPKQIETKMDKTTTNIAVSQINKNLGKFDQTYMTDEFLQQIVGNAPINAIPADYSITTKKLAFKPIEGVASKNLYNKNDVLKDTHINGNDGSNLSLAGYYASNFIPAVANEKYTISGTAIGTLRVAFYDSSKNFLSKVDGTATFTTPLNTSYLRISISSSSYLNTTQLEVGEVATPYEEYKTKFTDSVIDDGAFDGKKIKHKTINQEHLDFVPITGIKSKNLFNKDSILRDSFINNLTGEIIPMVGYFASDYILIDGNTTYSISPTEKFTRVAFYDMSKKYLSSATDNSTTITTPTNAVYVRVASKLNLLATTQFEKGSSPTSYVDYKITINPKHLTGGEITPPTPSQQKLLYTLNDAWVSWNAGEKFPMAFFGDSTIDGMGTTGFSGNGLGIDGNGKSPNSFSVKLESLLREVTGNNNIRIYNAGFSGMKADWGLANIDKEFGSTSGYRDVKMVGIGFGINDRLSYKTIKEYREGFKSNIKAMIEWFYEHDIQPFLLTTQALVSSDVETQHVTSFPLRTAMHIETVANEVKRELAKEYGLEIIDLHKFTTEFLLYSSYPTKTIIADRTHFGDIGHEYEAGVLFAHITPMVEIADGYTKIDFSNQKLKKGVPEELLTVPDTPSDSFKLYANYAKTDTTDLKIMDIYVFNTTRKTMTLKAFKNLSDSLTYVKLNGVNKNLPSLESNIGTLDLGVYHLEVWTGVSNKVDFKGFIIE